MDVSVNNHPELPIQDVENPDSQAVNTQSHEDEEPAMSVEATGLFLDEIQKKRKELHDPRHRRNKFFPEIRDRLMEKGLCFSIKTLEKRFDSLKKSFDTICQSKNRSNVISEKSISWPYFEKMMGIFAEELQIEDAPTMASLYPDPPLPRTAHSVQANNKKIKRQQQSESDLSSPEGSEEESEQDCDRETAWTNSVVMEFLNECIEKKKDFWDPSIRRQKVFGDINSQMAAKGYTFTPDSLNQKLRNLKVRYLVIMKNIQENEDDKEIRIRWPFFWKMHQIYDGCANRDMRRKHAEPISEPKNGYVELDIQSESADASPAKVNEEEPTPSSTHQRPKRRKLNIPFSSSFQDNFQKSIVALTSESRTSNNCPLSLEDSNTSYEDNNKPTIEEPIDAKLELRQTSQDAHTNDSEFAQKLLALEERRTIAIEQLLNEITESNRIREERLKFNRMKLEYLKNRQK